MVRGRSDISYLREEIIIQMLYLVMTRWLSPSIHYSNNQLVHVFNYILYTTIEVPLVFSIIQMDVR